MANQYKNKVIFNGITLIDLSDTTAVQSDVASGKSFYTASGQKLLGTGSIGNAISVVDATDSHGGTIRTITAVDISDTTAIASDVASGKYFYTANGIKTLGTGSGGSGGTGQTATGTVTGDGTNILEIPCNFAPDLIYVYGDMSGDVANRGVVSLTIIKDVAIYISSDSSASSTDEYADVLHDITGYNESDTSTLHATYSNNTLTIDTVQNSTSLKWRSGQVYNYELSTIGTSGGSSSPTLVTKEITSNGTYTASNDSADSYSSVTVNVPSSGITPTGSISITTNGTHDVTNYASAVVNVSSGGGTPSVTKHTIYFEFTDETNTSITAYYDNLFISNAITATIPTTYDSKTIQEASLDGVTWYIKPSEGWDTLYDGTITFSESDPNNQIWISSLGSLYPAVGEVYRVTIDNVIYNCTAHEDEGMVYIGNPKYDWGTDDGSDVPFCLFNKNYGGLQGWSELSATAHTIKIEKQLNWETLYENNSLQYVPESDTTIPPYCWISSLSDVYPTVGSVWRITFDGVTYRCTAVADGSIIVVGNPLYGLNANDDGSGVPFGFYNAGWGAWTGAAELQPYSIQHNVPVKIERLVTS